MGEFSKGQIAKIEEVKPGVDYRPKHIEGMTKFTHTVGSYRT